MAHEDIGQAGTDTLRGRAIKELQGLKSAVVAGAAAATNIAVTGIKKVDTLASVVEFAAGVPTDRTSEASITSDGNVQLSTTNSTGNKLQILYFKKPLPQ